MKHYFILMTIILGMIAPSASAQSAKQKVAVYVTGDVENGYKKVIGSKLVTGITRSDDYSAVERTADFLAELAKEHDYQTSGAVSDNQIAKLGHQFGVHYVLVADVSEIFESMFISARLIDVQTGQITIASEASSTVGSIDGLIELSEQIVLGLFGKISSGQGQQIKVIGPFMTYKALYDYATQIPEGYIMASRQDVENIIASYKMINKSILYPICTTIQIDKVQSESGDWLKYDYNIIGEILKEDKTFEPIKYEFKEYLGYKWSNRGLKYHLTPINNLYIYLIRNK